MIIVTNDDGIYSKGIKTLYAAAVEAFGQRNVLVVAPSGPRSASGMSLTFHKPLRIERVEVPGIRGFSVSGTPADCVFAAVFHIFKGGKIDLILSGINSGSNVSLQSIESSGTVSAVKFGSVCRIKGIAFSLALEMGLSKSTYANAKSQIVKLLLRIKKNGFPADVDILNVNLPTDVNNSTKWSICNMEDALFTDYISERKDLAGRKYYWLGGKSKKRFKKGTDCFELFVNHSIAISPMELATISDKLKRQSMEKLKGASIV
jgi:5'-nucleotidase